MYVATSSTSTNQNTNLSLNLVTGHTSNFSRKIKVPGTDLMVNDDWQNNMCAWFLEKYGIEGMIEFIEEHPTYLELLDKSLANYLKDMKKIVNRDKKILQILG